MVKKNGRQSNEDKAEEGLSAGAKETEEVEDHHKEKNNAFR